jgi:hypothetical protein
MGRDVETAPKRFCGFSAASFETEVRFVPKAACRGPHHRTQGLEHGSVLENSATQGSRVLLEA